MDSHHFDVSTQRMPPYNNTLSVVIVPAKPLGNQKPNFPFTKLPLEIQKRILQEYYNDASVTVTARSTNPQTFEVNSDITFGTLYACRHLYLESKLAKASAKDNLFTFDRSVFNGRYGLPDWNTIQPHIQAAATTISTIKCEYAFEITLARLKHCFPNLRRIEIQNSLLDGFKSVPIALGRAPLDAILSEYEQGPPYKLADWSTFQVQAWWEGTHAYQQDQALGLEVKFFLDFDIQKYWRNRGMELKARGYSLKLVVEYLMQDSGVTVLDMWLQPVDARGNEGRIQGSMGALLNHSF